MPFLLTHDGVAVGRPQDDELAVVGELHRHVGYSAAHALQHEGWAVISIPREIPQHELCLCIDETCPSCGHPERITPLPGAGAGEIFGCRRCPYVSRDRYS